MDWFTGNGEANSIEEALALGLKLNQNHGSKKDHSELNQLRFNKRCVGPSSTQVCQLGIKRNIMKLCTFLLALYGSNND